ncbi:MAG: tripartite tricarboxylate transporter substrate binding protein [Betaproteobacteria bacterium]
MIRSHSSPVIRRALAGLLACAALAPMASSAQEWPARPVRFVVPFATGGSADVFGRVVATRLQETLGQSFVIENRPGAGSIIGTDVVAKSPADGYTLLIMSNTHTVNESLIANKPFQLMRDFEPVAPINESDLVLVAKTALPASTISEILAAAKSKPDGMTYASSGNGTPYHMAGELLKAMAGIQIVHVPYKGSSQARTDVLGGQVDMMFDAIPTMVAQVSGGKVKAIATTGRERSAIMPNVPTVNESGVPGYTATIWIGVMAPKGTPAAIVNRLNAEIGKATSDPELRKRWAAQGTAAMTMNVAQFGKFLADDIAKWSGVVKSANIKAD